MHKSILVFLSLVIIEALSQTYGAAYGNKDIAAISYLLSGIAIGFLPLVYGSKLHPQTEGRFARSSTLKFIFFGALTSSILYFGIQAFRAQPLDYTFADMLPIIQIMGERWLEGGDVYAIIPEIWDGMQPIYLPMMWLSYVPAIALGVDIRIINLGSIVLAAALATGVFQKRTIAGWRNYIVYIPLLILLHYILITYSTFITISEEPLVVGFYALLGYSVYRQKPAWIVVALSACLLSRYALIFWAATYLFYMFWQEDRRRALWIMGSTAVVCLLLMLVSQGLWQLELFYSLKDAYLDSFQNPELAWRTKNTIANNIGLARFVPFENLVYLHQAVFWGSLAIPPALYTWYHFRLRDRVTPGLFAICSLKLCLVYFFNMNALPYSYLFYTSTFLSLVILGSLNMPLSEE